MASEKLYLDETPYEHQMINERGAQNYPVSMGFSRKISTTKGEKTILLIFIYYWSHLDLSAWYLLLLNMLYMSIRFFVQSGDVIDKWIEKANIYWRTTEFTSSQHGRQDILAKAVHVGIFCRIINLHGARNQNSNWSLMI